MSSNRSNKNYSTFLSLCQGKVCKQFFYYYLKKIQLLHLRINIFSENYFFSDADIVKPDVQQICLTRGMRGKAKEKSKCRKVSMCIKLKEKKERKKTNTNLHVFFNASWLHVWQIHVNMKTSVFVSNYSLFQALWGVISHSSICVCTHTRLHKYLKINSWIL